MYGYQEILQNPTDYAEAFVQEALFVNGCVNKIVAKDKDIVSLRPSGKLDSLLTRARACEKHLAYRANCPFTPLLPDIEVLSPMELARLEEEYYAQFQS